MEGRKTMTNDATAYRTNECYGAAELFRFRVGCEWKGVKATFDVVAPSKDNACDYAFGRSKALVGMPKSAVRTVAYVGRA
jgi:hypothetical protein